MRILHTADWHIGKKLYKYDLYEDFNCFVQWLTQIIRQKSIDVLLVSGDIFDSSNPSTEARKQFYETLLAIKHLDCQIVMTGGNHDSPSVLNAPSELLKELNIHIIGSLPTPISECIIPIRNKNNAIEIVIAAVPFLRDSELRKLTDGIAYEDKIKAIQNGIENIFEQVYQFCKEHFENIPIVAMGHLFAAGNISVSESEREIQIGNEARFDAQRLQQKFHYIALGHIHKPQKVSAAVPVYYSGSPISLSFSERNDTKRVLLIDTEKGFEPESILIPKFRKLIAIKGNLTEIKEKILRLEEKNQLKNLIEISLIEEKYSPKIEDDFNQFILSYQNEHYEIVKERKEFRDRVTASSELFSSQQRLEDLTPQDIFRKLLETYSYDEATHAELIKVFNELIEEVAQKDFILN